MKLRHFAYFALAAALFASCSDQQETGIGQAQKKVTFVSGLDGPVTRLSQDGSQWTAGDQVGIFMLESGKTTPVTYINTLYTAENSEAVTAFKSAGTPIFYPESEAPVDFTAYYPYNATVTTLVYPIALADQSAGAGAHDLMVAQANNNGKGFVSGPVAFTFKHQLSRFSLNIVDQKGDALTPEKVVIAGMPTTASFDLSTGTLSAGSAVANITAYKAASGCEAIVLPSIVKKGHAIQITAGGKTLTWDINNSYPDMEIKAGYAYTFKLTANMVNEEIAGVLVDFDNNSIAPWGTGESGEGESYTDLDLGFPAHENDDLVRAFPGAEGGGMFTTGGRGGRVIRVTNLNDSGTGSLRAALDESGPRTIVFDVDGVIELQRTLNVKNGDVTIAGQTAPGDGICLKNYSMVIGANNVIVRYIRSRMGDEKNEENDAMWGRYIKDIIIDHCSTSWSTDECTSFYANENFTMQWCILSESLRNSVHGKGKHGYGGIFGGVNASFHHNLLAHHQSRNPRFDGGDVYGTKDNALTSDQRAVDYRNCVVYNYGDYPAYGGEGQKVNFVSNYYKWGPATVNGVEAGANGKKRRYFYRVSGIKPGTTDDYGCPWVYMGGNTNIIETTDGNDNGVGADNWKGIEYDTENKGATNYTKLDAPVAIKPSGKASMVTTHTAAVAFGKVLDYAGANLKRDAVDNRAVNDTRTGKATVMDGGNGSINGLIDTQSAAGGWPTYKKGTVRVDTDGDGMPDAWEDAFGLNKNSAADGNTKTLDKSGRYTNLEMYLHYLVKETVNGQIKDGTYTTFN